MDQNNRSILNAIGLIGIVWFFIQGADLFSSHPIIKIASAISMKRQTVDQPVATMTMPPAVLRAVMFGDRTLHDTIQAGEATVTGSLDDAESFLGLFERPRLIERDPTETR